MSRLSMAVLLLSILAAFVAVDAKLQKVTVKGVAVCNRHRMPNVKVQLWDRDTFDPNDLLAEVHTNQQGEFNLVGEEDEVTSIEPFVLFEHACNIKDQCSRISEFVVPKDKIDGEYDMTFVALDIVQPKESKRC